MGVSAYADDRIQCFVDGDWLFSINPGTDHEVTVQDYRPNNGNFNIDDITEVTLPSSAVYDGENYSVTVLGKCLFSSVYVYGNYTDRWGHETFTKLRNVDIPESVTEIGESAFNGCSSLESVTIPPSVTVIGQWAFSDCSSLTAVAIPASVAEIGTGAFRRCKSLQVISVEAGNPNYTSQDGVLYDKDLKTLILCPAGKDVCDIPDSVTVIANAACSDCGLTSVTIPGTVVKIGDGAFMGCDSLPLVEIPASVTEIGESAFYNCSSMKQIVVSADNPNYSSHEGVLYDKDRKTLISCPGAKENCDIPDSVTKICNSAFRGCESLTSVTIPDSVEEIPYYSFESCHSLASVSIGNSVARIGGWAFSFCTSLTSVDIPDSVTFIGESAFSDCSSLASLTIGNSVTSIHARAFSGCTSLTSVIVPDSVDFMLMNVFAGCSSLESVVIGRSLSFIPDWCFNGCSSLTSVTIPDNVTLIAAGAFMDCSALTSIEIPASVTEIGGGAFSGCSALASVNIPDSVTKIGGSAFSGCSALASVTLPNDLNVIEGWTFNGCSSLTSVTIPAAVAEIGMFAFSECSSLNTVYALPSTPPMIPWNVFSVSDAVLYIPAGTLELYSATAWAWFTDIREMGALDIVMDQSALSVEVGHSALLTATVTKDDTVAVESEEWTSSNSDVAVVENGVVTGVAEGNATITFSVVDGYGCRHSAYCDVVVSKGTGINLPGNENDAESVE